MYRGVLHYEGMRILLDEKLLAGCTPNVVKVTFAKRKVTPPHSTVYVEHKMNTSLPGYFVELVEDTAVIFTVVIVTVWYKGLS